MSSPATGGRAGETTNGLEAIHILYTILYIISYNHIISQTLQTCASSGLPCAASPASMQSLKLTA